MARRRDPDHRPATLGYLWTDGMCEGVFCWCNRCSHNDVLPLGFMIAQFGMAFPVTEVYARLRCQACGSKDIHARPAWKSLGTVANHLPRPKGDGPPEALQTSSRKRRRKNPRRTPEKIEADS
jgi:hypothetical protein